MGDRALIIVTDDRQQRHFYQHHGPQQLLIPRLAGFVGWADAHAVPLTLPAYEAYAAACTDPLGDGIAPADLVIWPDWTTDTG
jgi:hypothetical protein